MAKKLIVLSSPSVVHLLLYSLVVYRILLMISELVWCYMTHFLSSYSFDVIDFYFVSLICLTPLVPFMDAQLLAWMVKHEPQVHG